MKTRLDFGMPTRATALHACLVAGAVLMAAWIVTSPGVLLLLS